MIRHGTVWERLTLTPAGHPPVAAGSTALNEALSGGLHSSTAYEVNGQEITGKTMWCAQRAIALKDTHHVCILSTNNIPAKRIFGDNVDIDNGMVLLPTKAGIRVVYVFSANSMLFALFRLYEQYTEVGSQMPLLVIIDSFTPILYALEEESFDKYVTDFRAAFFHLKAIGCITLAITNGLERELEEYVAEVLPSLFDAKLLFSWGPGPPEEGAPLRGPRVKLIRTRHGTGVPSEEITLPYCTDFGPVVDT